MWSRCCQDVVKMLSRCCPRFCSRCCQDVVKMLSKCGQVVVKLSSRCGLQVVQKFRSEREQPLNDKMLSTTLPGHLLLNTQVTLSTVIYVTMGASQCLLTMHTSQIQLHSYVNQVFLHELLIIGGSRNY